MSARARPILLGLLLFLGGAFAALLVEHTLLLHHQRPAGGTVSHRAILTHLDSALQLSPAQEESLTAIFNRHQPLVDSAWRSIHQRLYEAMDSVHHEVEAVLDSGQVVRFRDWARRQHELPRPASVLRHR